MQFKDVVGQEELKSHLIQEVNQGKISHAQMFLGNAGFGGLPLAMAFIQFLFCEQKQAKDSCGECNSCRRVHVMQHPDLHFSFPVVQIINKKSDFFLPIWRAQFAKDPYFNMNQWLNLIDDKGRNPIISTEESQEIIKKLSYKSFEGGYKVMVIWMAEKMNADCSNKLLKILEEPPAKTLFVLISDSQDELLPTIISRTQLLKVPRIQMDALSTHLQTNFDQDSSTATSIAAQTEGNLIDAIEMLNSNIEKNINRELFIQLMRVCYKKDVNPMLDWVEEISGIGKERQKTFLKYALHMFRQSILRNYTDNQLTKVSLEEEAFLKNFSKFITGNNIQGFMQNFDDAIFHIDRNANAKILFTELCFKVMRFIHFA